MTLRGPTGCGTATDQLREKRLPSALISEALEQIDEEEYNRILQALMETKRKEIKAVDGYTAGQKLLRFVAGRGFEPALAMKLIKEEERYEMDF